MSFLDQYDCQGLILRVLIYLSDRQDRISAVVPRPFFRFLQTDLLNLPVRRSYDILNLIKPIRI